MQLEVASGNIFAAEPASTADEAKQPTQVRSAWRAVAVPTEHGGWSLTAEPAVLGLIVAWSWSGLALGLAAMVAFVARTPIKAVLVDRWRQRWRDRTRLAATIAALEIAVLLALAGFAGAASSERFWVPLAIAAPLWALELWYDMRSRGRRMIPELAGAVGIGSFATAIALAAGAETRVAWGLWVVMGARALAAIPYVRTQILRTRSHPGPTWHSDVAQLSAACAALGAWTIDLVPGLAAIAIVILTAINVGALRVAPRPAVVIGVQQMVFGIAVISTTAIAIHVA